MRDGGKWYFKKYALSHSLSTLKVGTDAVLLGAWAKLPEPSGRILEVGCGCGVIASMLAQRYPASLITAIDIDPPSVREAHENLSQPFFGGRVTVVEADFLEYVQHSDLSYDLIVSNPPFFTHTHASSDERLSLAKHISSLTPEALFSASRLCLSEEGRVVLIVAWSLFEAFYKAAERSGFVLQELLRIRPISGAPTKRIVATWGLGATPQWCRCEDLVIESGGRHRYTSEYIALTREFYLNF